MDAACKHLRLAAIGLGATLLWGAVGAQPTSVPHPVTRGELLYNTHCIQCHTTQVHWRDKRLARDWGSLKAWVRHWQGTVGLGWNEDDIAAVARHLNDTVYHFEQTSDRLSQAEMPARSFPVPAALPR